METKAAEIAREQEYFDRAAKFRADKLHALGDAAQAAADPKAAARLKRYAGAAGQAAGGADEAVAVGQTEDESGEVLYIGRQLIRGDSDVLVVNWQAPAAAPYFEASHDNPRSLVRKRAFVCQGNTIQNFTDVVFAEISAAVDKHLLDELARGRTGEMRDIVATIQAAQYELIREPMEQVLVIEGGPGTGKTAVALHRVSWLLFHHRDRLRPSDVLVVGPNPTFVRYIDRVLPGLGDAEVQLREVARLGPDVHRGRTESAEVSRLKGDARMAGLLARALEARVGAPEPAERLLLGGRFVTLPGVDVAAVLADCRAAPLPYTGRRRMFRERLAQLVAERGGSAAGPDPGPVLANLVERLWPQQSPAAFLRELLGSRPRLAAAGGDEFTPDELAALHRRGADRVSEEIWSVADLALLDELDHLINGVERRYAHVVVDEAQDLSHMQLRSVARRSATGSMTLVGDIAQSTGAWARDSWEEVTRHLGARPAAVRGLRFGYRVPRQVYQLAARLLPIAAPAVEPPEVVRDGPAEPGIHRVGLADRAGRVAAIATARAADGQFVGIVCPPRCRRETEAVLAANGVEWSSAERGELSASINVVSPHEAKGLEFDAVVVVEPEQVVAGDEHGHRLLYVALTRTTRYLDIVCVGEPLPLSVPAIRDQDRQSAEPVGFTERDARRLAEHVAAQVRAAAPQSFWADVLARAERLLS